MKAILMVAAGPPDVLQLHTLPKPEIRSETELLVRLVAAGINPIDTKIRSRGTFYPDQMPAILGCDGAGIVEATGSQVQTFAAGDEVYFCHGGLGSTPGTYAEYVTIDERFVARKPKSLSFEAAAAAPLILITAWEALYERGRLEAGRRVLIQAGAGGVGHVAIQLAKLAGSQVCTTVSSPEKAEFACSLGADQAILYPDADVMDAVLAWTDGEGVDLSFDTVGGSILSQSIAATRIGGDVVTLHAPDPDTDWKTARNRNLRVSFELMLTPQLQNDEWAQIDQAKILQQCSRLIDQGELSVTLTTIFPLEQAVEAHRQIELGSSLGKIALRIQ